MSETLYPHEQVVKILKEPNSFWDSMIWLIFGYAAFLIQLFTIYAMVVINEPNITDFISVGFNICCYSTLVLVGCGLLGLAQSLWRASN